MDALARSTRGTVLAHDDVGEGMPLVLVHAFPLNRRMWAPQRALAAHARIIAVDLPGFGRSPAVAAPTIRGFADLVAAVLDAHDIMRAVIAGCSMGGYVAQAFALAYPQRTAALALVDTRAQPDTADVRARRDELVQIVRAQGLSPVPDRQLPKLLGGSAQRDAALVRLVREVILEATPEGIAQAAAAMASREDFRPLLPRITCPAAVITGTEDAIVPLEEARAVARALPRGRFVPVGGVGHLANLEAPAVVNEALRALLEEVPA